MKNKIIIKLLYISINFLNKNFINYVFHTTISLNEQFFLYI